MDPYEVVKSDANNVEEEEEDKPPTPPPLPTVIGISVDQEDLDDLLLEHPQRSPRIDSNRFGSSGSSLSSYSRSPSTNGMTRPECVFGWKLQLGLGLNFWFWSFDYVLINFLWENLSIGGNLLFIFIA